MRKWLLAGIIALAFILRITALDRFPAGFTPDEASFGYDAYSLLTTGKDQWGHSFPLVLESFGDFKPPLYSYLQVPFVKFLGLNKTAVRLPNAIFGSLAIIATFLFVSELAKYTDLKKDKRELLKYMSALLLAISPWHVMLSRGAFEANLTTLFLPLGSLLFIKGLKKQSLLKWSALFFGINLFSYHSAKLVTPILILFLVLTFRDEVKKIKLSKLVVSSAILIIFISLTAYTFTSGAGVRVADINIFKGTSDSA